MRLRSYPYGVAGTAVSSNLNNLNQIYFAAKC